MTDVNYVFSAEPRPVQTIEQRKQPRYREAANLMFDRRVIRGPTYRSKADLSATAITPQPKPSLTKPPAPHTTRPPKPASSTTLLPTTSANPSHLTTHTIHIQTDDYLEELTDETFEQDGATQTDAALLPPSSSSASLASLYVAKARGTDAATSIDGVELFDFDSAVLPILATLTARTLDQALVEVREEQEMHLLLTQRLRFERERDISQAEVARLQASHERRMKEKEARFAAERSRLLAAQHAAQQRAATEAAERAMEAVRREEESRAKAAEGDPLEEEVKAQFMPWLMAEVRQKVETEERARRAMDDLIQAGLERLRGERRKEEERREAARLAELEEQRTKEAEAEAERQRKAAAEAAKAAELAEAARLAAEAEAAKAVEEGEEQEDAED